jgi:transcriptional regulator with XRE-family HTH domain
MTEAILTPDDAKQARAAIGLSQIKVAQATGISRTSLALFEVNKYLLDDEALMKLEQFFEAAGYTFSNSPVEQADSAAGYRLMDGFAVLEGFTEDEAESILDDIHANDIEIETLSCQKAGVGFWSEQPKTEGLNQLLVLHARNYVLTRRLQGHALLNNTVRPEDTPLEEITNSMLFNEAVSA